MKQRMESRISALETDRLKLLIANLVVDTAKHAARSLDQAEYCDEYLLHCHYSLTQLLNLTAH